MGSPAEGHSFWELHCEERGGGDSQVDLSAGEIIALLNKYLMSSCLTLFPGIFSGLKQAFPACSDPLFGPSEEEGEGRFLIKEQLGSRKWLFGTDCSAELGGVDGADAGRSVRRIRLVLTLIPPTRTAWATEDPAGSSTPCYADSLLSRSLFLELKIQRPWSKWGKSSF